MRHVLASILVVACGSRPPPESVTATSAEPATSSAPEPAPRSREPDSPYDAKVWVAKLDDPRESERAVTELEQLGDPSAIPALGEAWLRDGRPVRMLQVIISLARPLTPEEARATFVVDYEAKGRPASWDKAMPFLLRAVAEVDEANPRSVDSATKAAVALGEAKQGLDVLIDVALRAVTKKLIVTQIAAIRVIGSFAGDAKAAKGLIKIIQRDPPPHPRTAARGESRSLEEKFGLYLGTVGASINALAELRNPAAAGPLIIAMYRTPELFTQVRRALVATGPAAKAELVQVLRGKHAKVNDVFGAHKLDQYCGDRGDQPCVRVSARDFYASVVLGDFYDPAVAPELVAVLKRPAAPVYFSDEQPSLNTQHHAAFDALRKIGAPDAAAPLRALWSFKSKADLQTRWLAIAAYPFVARDATGVRDLGTIAADNAADDTLRTEAATAVARLSTDANDVKIFTGLAAKYLKASDDKTKEAAKHQKTAAAADQVLEAARQALGTSKADLLTITKDATKTAAEIKAAAQATRQAEDDYKAAKKKHRDQAAPFKQANTAAKAYVGYARMFQTHAARIDIAIRCKGVVRCFADTLTMTTAQAAKNNERYIKDLAIWTDDEKQGLVIAAIDRAMLELAKLGPAATGQTDVLLDAAKGDDRQIRQAILLALPRIAKLPCAQCEVKLDAAIKAGEGKATLGDLNFETTMLRNYFAWAGVAAP